MLHVIRQTFLSELFLSNHICNLSPRNVLLFMFGGAITFVIYHIRVILYISFIILLVISLLNWTFKMELGTVIVENFLVTFSAIKQFEV